jgi:hypothetical protein
MINPEEGQTLGKDSKYPTVRPEHYDLKVRKRLQFVEMVGDDGRYIMPPKLVEVLGNDCENI